MRLRLESENRQDRARPGFNRLGLLLSHMVLRTAVKTDVNGALACVLRAPHAFASFPHAWRSRQPRAPPGAVLSCHRVGYLPRDGTVISKTNPVGSSVVTVASLLPVVSPWVTPTTLCR